MTLLGTSLRSKWLAGLSVSHFFVIGKMQDFSAFSSTSSRTRGHNDLKGPSPGYITGSLEAQDT